MSILAERLNNSRFWAHLRSVHRGAYFVERKMTGVRKLLPESWGFLCPVHTPDGGLCGLLNHLSLGCQLDCYNLKQLDKKSYDHFLNILVEYGMSMEHTYPFTNKDHLLVIFDSVILGSVEK